MIKKLLILIVVIGSMFSINLSLGAEVLRVPLISLPKELVPAKILDVSSSMIMNQIYEGLFDYDSSDRLRPNLISSFSISPDGLTYILALKSNILFSDGKTVLDAKKVVDSLKDAILLLKNASRWAFGSVKGFDQFVKGEKKELEGLTYNDNKIVIQLAEPYSPLLQVFATPYFKITLKKDGRYLGTGPFAVYNKSDNKIILRVLDWQREGLYIDEIIFEKVNSRKEMTLPQNLARFDLIDVLATMKIDSPFHNALTFPYLQANILTFNTKDGLFGDRAKRQQFSSLVKSKIKLALLGWKDMAQGLPFGNNIFVNDNDNHKVAWSHRKKIKIYYTDTFAAFNLDGLKGVERDLKEIGVDVEFVRESVASLVAKIKNSNFQVALLGFIPDIIDPDGFFSPLLGTGQQFNFSGYSSSNVDELLSKGRVEQDVNARLSVYNTVAKVASRDMPIAFLGTTHGKLLVSKKIKTTEINSLGIGMLNFASFKPNYSRAGTEYKK